MKMFALLLLTLVTNHAFAFEPVTWSCGAKDSSAEYLAGFLTSAGELRVVAGDAGGGLTHILGGKIYLRDLPAYRGAKVLGHERLSGFLQVSKEEIAANDCLQIALILGHGDAKTENFCSKFLLDLKTNRIQYEVRSFKKVDEVFTSKKAWERGTVVISRSLDCKVDLNPID